MLLAVEERAIDGLVWAEKVSRQSAESISCCIVIQTGTAAWPFFRSRFAGSNPFAPIMESAAYNTLSKLPTFLARFVTTLPRVASAF
jgi:hypothetical protein